VVASEPQVVQSRLMKECKAPAAEMCVAAAMASGGLGPVPYVHPAHIIVSPTPATAPAAMSSSFPTE
jgi:hypothetical protein